MHHTQCFSVHLHLFPNTVRALKSCSRGGAIHCLKFVNVFLAIVLSEVLTTPAVPAVRTSVEKNRRTSNEFEIEDDEPLYAYVYEYEDNGDQIWSDCSKLTHCQLLLVISSSVGVPVFRQVCHKSVIHISHCQAVLYGRSVYQNIQTQLMISPCTAGKDQSVMKIEDIELDPNPPQKGEPVTVTVKAKLCKSCI